MKINQPWVVSLNEEDPTLSLAFKGNDPYANFRDFAFNIQKKHGNDLLMWNRIPEDAPEYVEGKEYSNYELGLMADAMLRADVKKELCRECQEEGVKTSEFKLEPQFDDETGDPVLNEDGKQLHLKFFRLICKNDHKWYQGDGKTRSIGGKNPILFEEHIQARKRREIYTSTGDNPDPSIVSGIYNRSHPAGRKVNTDEARKKHGASWYR